MTALFDRLPKVQIAGLMLVAVAWLALPLLVRQPYILHVLILSMLFATFAMGWNLVTGFAGLKTFGHHAFFALSAYASALLSKNLGISPWITIWIGAAVATITGVLVAMPALRIRSIAHIAIVTLAFAEIVRICLSNLKDLTRGEMGLFGIPAFDPIVLPLVGQISFGAAAKVPFYYLASLTMLVTSLGLYGLMRSRFGLALVAMRGSQDATESLGINLAFFKILAFALSAFIVGISGALYAHYIMVLTPASVAGADVIVFVIAMVLVGGIGSHLGPILGAFLLTVGGEALREIGDYRMLIYGVLIIVVMRFYPQGVVKLLDTAIAAAQRWWQPRCGAETSHEVT